MALQHYLFPICFVLAFSFANCVQTVNGKIKITVGTTSACGDTVNFFKNHLVPTYALYGDFLDLEIVPWGRTVRHADGTMTCQFLANDCWANRVQRCALNMLKGNQKAQLDYMACELTPPLPAFSQGSYVCAREAGINLVQLDYCVNNPNMDSLDEDAENASLVPMQVIDFVPSITFNDNPDKDVHFQAFQRLSSVICFALADDPTTGVTGCQI